MKKLFLLLLLPTVAWADQPVGYNATTGKVSPNVPMEFQKTIGFTRTAVGNMGATRAIDWNKPTQTMTIDQASTITFTNLPANGVDRTIKVFFLNNGFALTWPVGIFPATMTGINSAVSSVSSVLLETTDGGTTVYWWSDYATIPVEFSIPVSDETTTITIGNAKFTWRAPYAFTVTSVRASVNTVSSSGIPTVDINESGTTILSTKLTIDANEKTSVTAATAAVISDSSIADDAEITMDIDVAGTGAKGLKVWIRGTRP